MTKSPQFFWRYSAISIEVHVFTIFILWKQGPFTKYFQASTADISWGTLISYNEIHLFQKRMDFNIWRFFRILVVFSEYMKYNAIDLKTWVFLGGFFKVKPKLSI